MLRHIYYIHAPMHSLGCTLSNFCLPSSSPIPSSPPVVSSFMWRRRRIMLASCRLDLRSFTHAGNPHVGQHEFRPLSAPRIHILKQVTRSTQLYILKKWLGTNKLMAVTFALYSGLLSPLSHNKWLTMGQEGQEVNMVNMRTPTTYQDIVQQFTNMYPTCKSDGHSYPECTGLSWCGCYGPTCERIHDKCICMPLHRTEAFCALWVYCRN